MPARTSTRIVEPDARNPTNEWEPEPLHLPLEMPSCPLGIEVPSGRGDDEAGDRLGRVIVIDLA